MQVNIDIRFGKRTVDNIENLPVKVVLIPCECWRCKDQRFHKVIISNRKRLEEILWNQFFFKLFIPACKKWKFERKRIFFRVIIEFWQERIVGKMFKDQICIELICYSSGKGSFPGTDISFYNHIVVPNLHPWILLLLQSIKFINWNWNSNKKSRNCGILLFILIFFRIFFLILLSRWTWKKFFSG